MAETNATPIAAAVSSEEIKSNRKDFFLGQKEHIIFRPSLNRNFDGPDDLREHGIGLAAVAVTARITRIDRDAMAEDRDGQSFDVISYAIRAVFGEGQRLSGAVQRQGPARADAQ